MKLQTTKNLFAFIIVMMFSFSYLNAQCLTCKGDKVAMYQWTFTKNGNAHLLASKCVQPDQVQNFVKKGWTLLCFQTTQNSNRILQKSPGRSLAKIPTDNVTISKENGQRLEY